MKLLFDMDGPLTISRMAISAELNNMLKICVDDYGHELNLVTGASLPQVYKQLGPSCSKTSTRMVHRGTGRCGMTCLKTCRVS